MSPPSGKGPKFMGEPSPSVRKMRRMSRAELAEHIQRLQEHLTGITRRIAAFERQPQAPPERFEKLNQLQERIEALVEEARRLHRHKD